MSALEQIVQAETSSNLQHRESRCAVDVLRAVALAGIRAPFLSLFRVKYLADYNELHTARTIFGKWAYNDLMKAGQEPHNASRVGAQAFDQWVDDRCKVCNGLGYALIVNTPTLSDITCQHCNSGMKKVRRSAAGEIARKLHERADEAVRVIRRQVSNILQGA